MSLPAVSSTTEVVTEEATCLQELSDAEAIHGPFNPQLLSAIQKLSDFYQKSGEITKLESMLQRTLMFDERKAGRIHRDTNGTSFKLIDVYIQGGKLKEARILLERIEESYLKLETNPNSELRVLYRTEMGAERLALRRLGLEFRKRNFHDGAVNMLERAFESHSKALGDSHTTTIAVSQALSYSYLQQFYQQPLRDDRPRHQCVVKLAQLCERTLKVERDHIWMLGLMCLRSNDAVNASFAFKRPTKFGICGICEEKIKPRTRFLACKSCLLLVVCDGCYQKWEARTEHEKQLVATCPGHTFYIVGVEDTDQASARGVDDEEEVGLWLSKIIAQKTTQATTNSFLDYWERRWKPEELREFRSPVYFYESDSLPAHVDEVKAKAVVMQMLKWRKSWTTVRVPMLLGLFFTPKGFSILELPQRNLDETASEDDLESELVERAQAILRLAGVPAVSTSEHDMLRHEPESVVAKLYQNFRLTDHGNCIRLLALLPGEGPTLKATIYCVNLSSNPIYEALSYVWGETEAKSSHFIEIEGTNMG